MGITKAVYYSENKLRLTQRSDGENTAQTKCKTKHGSALAFKQRLSDWVGSAWAFKTITAIPKAIAKIAARSWNLKDHDDSSARAKEVTMAKVIEFYIPQNFRRATKWIPNAQRGKILELRPQTKKSA